VAEGSEVRVDAAGSWACGWRWAAAGRSVRSGERECWRRLKTQRTKERWTDLGRYSWGKICRPLDLRCGRRCYGGQRCWLLRVKKKGKPAGREERKMVSSGGKWEGKMARGGKDGRGRVEKKIHGVWLLFCLGQRLAVPSFGRGKWTVVG